MLSNAEDKQRLADMFREARADAKLTLRETSAQLKAIGFSSLGHSVVQKIERNQRRVDIVEFVKLCHVYNVDPVDKLEQLMCKGAV